MSDSQPRTQRIEYVALFLILLLSLVLSTVGITWGLPSLQNDKYLFGGEPVWTGEKIYRLAGGKGKFDATRGADVDADPLSKSRDGATLLTGSEEAIARILLRYRLYTYQPDEMITMMALAGMRPGSLELDPRLYQYGGLFIYPVGALIKLCGWLGLIDVRSNVVYYLDHPDEFGKFYIVARAYAAFWGLVAVAAVFAIGRRLGGGAAGIVAAMLFALMPVVICMSHEGKPHLPGAAIMLLAVLAGMHNTSRRAWWLMCICCGAAFGMVLSSLPIFVLIPMAAWMRNDGQCADEEGGRGRAAILEIAKQSAGGIAVATIAYLLTNPYVLINVIANRQVLASNFGNSLGMYEVSRVLEGLVRVSLLTVEGASWPVAVLGVMGLAVFVLRKDRPSWVLLVPAGVFFVQFVFIGAGKPAEYGRFGVFTDAALAIGAGCLLTRSSRAVPALLQWAVTVLVISAVFLAGARYLWGFQADAAGEGTRDRLAAYLSSDESSEIRDRTIVLAAEPAPYGCPPLHFASRRVMLANDGRAGEKTPVDGEWIRIRAADELPLATAAAGEFEQWSIAPKAPAWIPRPVISPISWANKPFLLTTE